jgi:hypothetical protein
VFYLFELLLVFEWQAIIVQSLVGSREEVGERERWRKRERNKRLLNGYS